MSKKLVAAMLLTLGVAVAVPAASAQAATVVRSGMEIDVPDTLVTVSSCTLGAVVSPTKALTAGHCGNVGQAVLNAAGVRIGTISANKIRSGLDVASIRLAPGVVARVDNIGWGATFYRGEPVTKSGVTTGLGRGVVTNPTPTVRTARGFSFAPPFLISHRTLSVSTTLIARPGDSGGPVRDSSGRIVGIVSASGENFTIFSPVSAVPGYMR